MKSILPILLQILFFPVADEVRGYCHSLVTHPSISVGVRPREQGMENDDRFIQVPDEHPLESRSARGEEKHKERQRAEAKSMAFSVGLQSDPPAQ